MAGRVGIDLNIPRRVESDHPVLDVQPLIVVYPPGEVWWAGGSLTVMGMAFAAKGSKGESFLAVVVGGGAAFGLIVLTSRAWKACRVDVTGSVPNGLTLLFLGVPIALIVNLVLFTVVFRYAGKAFLFSLIAAAIALAIADLALFSWQGTPAGSPGSCPGNVPPWWPTWIPT